jgi:methylated-DNA-[protein]-cysteine S-methyltransferase
MGVDVLAYDVDGWGVGQLWVERGVVLAHELPVARASSAPRRAHPLVDRVLAYFGGARDSYADVPLDLAWATPFQRAVVAALRRVPYGETATYGELAALAGHPGAHRAAGSMCAANRFGLFVPCHRVVAAAGVGPYGSLGSAYKRRLLELEGAAVPAG